LAIESLEQRALLTSLAVGTWPIGPPVVPAQPTSGTLSQTAAFHAADGVTGDGFGSAVAIDGNVMVVGAPMATVNGHTTQGAAYVFVATGPGWTNVKQVAKLTASDGKAGDVFGGAVAISGNTIVVGACSLAGLGGLPAHERVYVFSDPESGWANMTQTAELSGTGLGSYSGSDPPFTEFGKTVAISGNTIVVGAAASGAVCVYTKPASGWQNMTQTATLTASDALGEWGLGTSVSISGDTIAAGSQGDNSIYVFTKPAAGWKSMTQTAELTAPNGVWDSTLGGSVSISGDTIMAAAYSNLVFNGPLHFGPPLVVSSISPTIGSTSGGTAVTITGSGFFSGGSLGLSSSNGLASLSTSSTTGGPRVTAVYFGRRLATSFTVISDTQIVAIAPPGIGTMDVRVSTGDFSSMSAASFGDQFTMSDNGIPPPAHNNAFLGVTYVFTKPPTGWTDETPVAELSPSDGAIGESMQPGPQVAISANAGGGNTVVVAAGNADYVYTEPASGWHDMTESATLAATKYSLSISGVAAASGVVVAGGNQYYPLPNAGAAYIYALPGQNAPTITSTPPGTAMVGQKYIYQVKASAAAGQVVTFSLRSAPFGMTINAATGIVSWLPNVFQAGAFSVTIAASDQYGNVNQQLFFVQVAAAKYYFPSVPYGPVQPGNQAGGSVPILPKWWG
jgi:hypothetical protein